MKRVQLDFEHLFYVEKLENRTIKVRKESNIGKPTKSLTPALMSCQIALTNSSGYWYKVEKNRRNHVGQECRFTTPGRLPIMSIHTPPQLEALLDLTPHYKG